MRSRRQVLLVDDDDSLRRALTRTIRLAGYDVRAYNSVGALLEVGIATDQSCLVLDVNLPGIGGIEFRNSLAEAHFKVPTIFITALERDLVAAQLSKAEYVAVLYKPFSNKDLLDAIDRAIGADIAAPTPLQ